MKLPEQIFIGECHLVGYGEDFSARESCFKVVRIFSNQRINMKNQQQNQRHIWQLRGHTFGGLALVPADLSDTDYADKQGGFHIF